VSRLFRWLGSGFSDCTSYRFELVAGGLSGGTWPTRWATSTPRCPGTAPRWSRTPCASPTSTGARRVSGGSSTAMPTPPRFIRLLPPTHRRSKRQVMYSPAERGNCGSPASTSSSRDDADGRCRLSSRPSDGRGRRSSRRRSVLTGRSAAWSWDRPDPATARRGAGHQG
jgi:hypothetical protein